MLRENQLKNMKEQNEILNQNIHLNDDKKELFELNNNNNDSKNMNKLLSNVIYKSIAKNRRGYLFKDLSTNTKKLFDGYNKDIPEVLELNNTNNMNNSINKNKNFQNGNGIGELPKENANNENIINSNGFNQMNNIMENKNNNNNNSKKFYINFNLIHDQNSN